AASHPIRITSRLYNRVHSDDASAKSSPFRSAESIIASCIAQVTRRHGGADSTLIRSLWRSSFGSTRGQITHWRRSRRWQRAKTPEVLGHDNTPTSHDTCTNRETPDLLEAPSAIGWPRAGRPRALAPQYPGCSAARTARLRNLSLA